MIAVCTPARDTVQATFVADLIGLLKYSPEAEFILCQGSYIPNNRLSLVRTALLAKATHILFIDSDMRLPADSLERLLSHNKDIIGANCRQRTQNEWTARKDNEFISSEGKLGLEEVDMLGMGVTLIKTAIFDKLKQPWFAMPYDTLNAKLVGEDVYFCVTAKEQGFKIWVDHDLSQHIKHTGSIEYGI